MARDPERAVTLRPVSLGAKTVPAYSEVWVLSRADGHVEVEYRDSRGRIREDVLSPYPVKGPGLEMLRRLDACFGLGDDAFVREHIDGERYFQILRCRAHGMRFLRDTRGTIAWYSLMTLLREDDDGSPADIWSKYHAMPDAQLLLEGRTR